MFAADNTVVNGGRPLRQGHCLVLSGSERRTDKSVIMASFTATPVQVALNTALACVGPPQAGIE